MTLCAGDKAAARNVMSISDALGRLPAIAYSDLEAVADSPLSSRVILAFRDLFLARVDRGLQQLYRDSLTVEPPASGLGHYQKIAVLQRLRPQAVACVSGFDWEWLVNWLQLSNIGETIDTTLNRLSNFAFPCDALNLRFSRHCNIRCRHCYNHSGPESKDQTAALPELLAIVAQMPAAGFRRLALSGGEPFLYQDYVMALIRAARDAGVREIRISTNGFWANTVERTDHVLERLRQAGFMSNGLDMLKVSVGPYHQEFIPLEMPLMIADRFHQMFGCKLKFDVELTEECPGFMDHLHTVLASVRLMEHVTLRPRTIVAMGRGINLAVKGFQTTGYAPCDGIKSIVIEPNGMVLPCCRMNADNDGIVIGQSKDNDLRGLVKRMQNDPLLQFMSKYPMKNLFSLNNISEFRNEYCDSCQLCQDAIGTLRDKEVVQSKLFSSQKYYPFWFTRNDVLT